MHTIADAEKRTGATHWTLYDGSGRVWRARRIPGATAWEATEERALPPYYCRARTLLDLRKRVCAEAAKLGPVDPYLGWRQISV